VRAWITGADLATLDAERIMTELRHASASLDLLDRRRSGLGREMLDVLVARAATSLAADVDRLIDDLRPAWDVTADVVAAAAATGISSASTAADVIKLGDDAVAAWRTLPPALATSTGYTSCYCSPDANSVRATSASSAGWTGSTPGHRH
jgi:hypothetical protein